MKIYESNYTQIPNCIIKGMRELSDAEFRVIMVIARKTFGWHKTRDRISLSQIMKISGMSRQGVINGKTGLIKKGLIIEFEVPNGREYEINVIEQPVNNIDQTESNQSTMLTSLVNEVDQFETKVVNGVDTQKKHILNKLSKENNIQSLLETIAHEPLKAALTEWITMRKEMKKPVTAIALTRTIKNLSEWYPGDFGKQVACVCVSVGNSYQGIFKLKENYSKPTKIEIDPAARLLELNAQRGNK